MGGEDEDLGNLDVGGGVGGKDGYVGNVVAGKGLDALVDIGGAVVVAVEADVAEIGFNESCLEIGNAYCGVGDINT